MGVRIEAGAEPITGYKLVERLGGGGFGEVWKAVAPGGLMKAIKFVFGDLQGTAEEGQRAEQELKALSRVKSIRHPYILSLERFDIIDGQLMIVMELADRNLFDRLKECRQQGLPGIPREELLGYMEEAAEALDLMNSEYQLQHLDIKPQNVFLIYNHVKIADFGLVKDLAGMMASLTGGVTPVYAAPETFDGWVSRFSDQYSLAIVYQELLTGIRPFSSTSIAQLIQQHLQAPPNLTPLPAGDRPAVARALAKNPDQRYPSCMDLVRSLRGARSASTAKPAPGKQEHASQSDAEPRNTNRMLSPDSLPAFPTDYHKGTDTQERGDVPSEMVSAAGGRATHWIQVGKKGQATSDPVAESMVVGDLLTPRAIIEGDGVLVPALIIGLGSLGRTMLHNIREQLHHRFGSMDALPHIRLLHIDTDPDAAKQAAEGGPERALAPHEVLLARLNRPSHYLKSPEIKGKLASWFNIQMLYRIPRNQITTGVRALGRLALFDNYRIIQRRLRSELDAITDPENLTTAEQQAKLAIRTNRPRVYLLTGLAGGTGSGMFLDLAYILRRMMLAMGFEVPETIGVLLVPSPDRDAAQTLPLGNTFAALTELNHYSAAGTTFVAHYDEREKQIIDPDPPFLRVIVHPLPQGSGSVSEALAPLADYIYRDLVTPLGRTSDEARHQVPEQPRQQWGLSVLAVGLNRLSFPRRILLQQLAGRVCLTLAQRWASKDATQLRAPLQDVVAAYWGEQQLSGDLILRQLEAACAKALGQKPDVAFASMLEPLAKLNSQNPTEVGGFFKDWLQSHDATIGRHDDTLGSPAGSLAEPLAHAAEKLAQDWRKRLAGFALDLVEQPGYRLAGAEEAVRQCVQELEKLLQQQESLNRDLIGRVRESRERLESAITSLLAGQATSGRRGPPLAPAAIELAKVYPHWRLQSLCVQKSVSVLVSVRGHLSDQLREINFCRNRLLDLIGSFESGPLTEGGQSDQGASRLLFPEGSSSLLEAVDVLQTRITDEDLNGLEREQQRMMREQFQGLMSVCMTSANLLRKLNVAMREVAEKYLANRFDKANVAELYLSQLESAEQKLDDVASLYQQAVPDLCPKSNGQSEVCVVMVPPGQAGDEFAELARAAISVGQPHVVVGPEDDLVVYRENPRLFLADLEVLGSIGYDAYRQMAGAESFTPHTRIDVLQWRAAKLV